MIVLENAGVVIDGTFDQLTFSIDKVIKESITFDDSCFNPFLDVEGTSDKNCCMIQNLN